ncbi:LLM class F420-dependent oxidoreductase [Allokutzneria sp. NRRL B-24872]|uniref:LLM class F420-dependent oxidoreductase n=1 Tax=Allokutzneria sp. NRRL B-24872 TaxID=1137961 RepID=UPI000A36683C|nr:LLM class F420-dependent oxidoreductase [Allokutzneria sp. NRRL B-24872]
MQFGAYTFVTDEGIHPAELARALEERGFSALFVPEHTHMPLDHTPYPGGGPVPRRYCRSLDPFVVLATAAAVTERLVLGTAIALLVQRDPIVLAKEVASIDHLSGGRVELGVGAGWNRPEIANHGVDPRVRTRVLRERVLAVKEIWTNEVAEFHGEHVDFGPMRSWPKPVRAPHPPVLLGGWGPTLVERIVDHAEGWIAPPPFGPEKVAERVVELRRAAEEAGKPMPSVTAYVHGPDQRVIDGFAEAGADRLLLSLPVAGREESLRLLDDFVTRIAI